MLCRQRGRGGVRARPAAGSGVRVLGSCVDHAQAGSDHQPAAHASRGVSGLPRRRALVTEHPGEFQDHHGNQRDSGDDRHPGRRLDRAARIAVAGASRGAGAAGGGGADGSELSLIPRIMPQVCGVRDQSVTGVGYPKRRARRPCRVRRAGGNSGYGCAGANDGATDSGMCDGPGPSKPWWKPAPWPWCCGPPCRGSSSGGASRGDGSGDGPGGRP